MSARFSKLKTVRLTDDDGSGLDREEEEEEGEVEEEREEQHIKLISAELRPELCRYQAYIG